VSFSIVGFRDASASCRLWVHTQPSTFYDGAGAYAILSLPIDEATLTANVTLANVPSSTSGYVAAFAVHDENANGVPDSNFIGYPTEGVTATRGARGGPFGGPYWEDAHVSISSPEVEACMHTELRMWYP
jgi:uncharacterized protein (DUF2141 family)